MPYLQCPLLVLLAGDISPNPGPNDVLKASGAGNGISFCHWNVQSLTDTKFEEISSLLGAQDNRNRANVVILTETFLTNKKPNSIYNIPDYDLYRRDRIGKKGSGLLVYVNNRLTSNQRDDLMSTDCETLWLEVFPYKRPLLVAGVYRPPSSKLQDDLKFCSNIESAYLFNLETIILGDFNIDVLKPDHNKHKLFKFLKNLHLTQKVNQATRPISGSCLDHLWVSHPERIATGEVKLSGSEEIQQRS